MSSGTLEVSARISVQPPTGDRVLCRASFRTVLAAVVLLLGGCTARSAVAVPPPPPPPAEAGPQEVASDPGPHEKHEKDKPDPKTSETTDPASESSNSSAQSDSSDKSNTSGKSGKSDDPASAEGDSSANAKLSSVETVDERRTRLEGELDSSLREFDGLILKEQELLEEERAAAESAGGEAESGEVTGSGGTDGAEDGTNAQATEEASAGGTGGSPDMPAGEPVGGEPTDTETGGNRPEIANGRVPPDVGDGHDDDIVARQLREAAMQEEDPALREKLWDEYRAYKFGTRKGSEKDGSGDGSNKDKKNDNPT